MDTERCKDTEDMFVEPKRKPGRRPMMKSGAMSSAEKMRKAREKMAAALKSGNPASWDAKTCVEGMGNKVYDERKREAWEQFGRLNGYIED